MAKSRTSQKKKNALKRNFCIYREKNLSLRKYGGGRSLEISNVKLS